MKKLHPLILIFFLTIVLFPLIVFYAVRIVKDEEREFDRAENPVLFDQQTPPKNEDFSGTDFEVKYLEVSPTSTGVMVIKLTSDNITTTIRTSDVPKFVSDWRTKENTLVINGGYFHEDFSPSGYLVANWKRIGNRQFDTDKSGLLTVEPDGKVKLQDLQDQILREKELPRFALQSYPFLIKKGTAAIAKDSGLLARRTAIGTDKDGNMYIIFSPSLVSLYELMNVLLKSGISFEHVLNLDGGPSSGFSLDYKNYKKEVNSQTPVPSVLEFSFR